MTLPVSEQGLKVSTVNNFLTKFQNYRKVGSPVQIMQFSLNHFYVTDLIL